MSRESVLMKMNMSVIVCLSGGLIGGASLQADTSSPDPAVVRSAIEKSILLLEKTTAGASEHNRCFTCHGHAMPMSLSWKRDVEDFSSTKKTLKRR